MILTEIMHLFENRGREGLIVDPITVQTGCRKREYMKTLKYILSE